MYCLECYTENPEGVLFCENCGCPFGSNEKREEKNLLKDRYKIISSLSSGGIGGISLGYDVRLNRACAIKAIYRKGLKDLPEDEKEKILKPFRKEAELLANLRHPNLPCVTDYFIENDICYLVMDYIEGKDLEIILEEQKEEKRLSEKQVIEWAIQICRVLEYLHEQKPPIIHGDIKLANLIIRDSDGWIILVDFGSASIEPESEIEDAYVTDGYAPPEQYIGVKEVRSDIYSLGVTIYELLTGTLPEEPFKFTSLRKIVPELSSDIENIVMKCIEYDVENRYSNSTILKQELLAIYKKNFCKPDSRYRTGHLIYKDKISNNETESSNEYIKILIVDKDKDMCNNFRDVATFFKGIKVIGVAYDGESAIHLITGLEEKPDVIIMDTNLPVMNGIVALRDIKNIAPLSKIIILTDSLVEEEFMECFKIGASGYILKGDTSWEDLEKSIKKVYEGGTPISPDASTLLLKTLTLQQIPRGVNSIEKKESSEVPAKSNNLVNEEVVEEIIILEGDEGEDIEEIIVIEEDENGYLVINEEDYLSEEVSEEIAEKDDNLEEELYRLTKAEELKEIARKYIIKDDLAGALIYLKEALKYDSLDPVVNYELGNIYYAKEDLDGALEYYKTAIEGYPDKIEIYSDIGQIYLEKGEFENAIPYYDKALEINPKYTEAYSRLGYIKYKLGDLSSALQYFGYVIEIDSNFGEAYIGLAHVYQAQKDFYSAIRNYEKSLDIDKDCIEAYHNLGLIYIYKGEFKKALNYLREAIKLNLKLIQVYDELVERIRSESKYNPSEEDLKKYLCTYSIKKEDFPVLAQIINNIERSYKGEFIYSEKISSEVEISDSESVNICINCENLNRRNANFCRTCGVEFMSGDEINRSLVDEFIQLILKEDEERLCCKDSLTTEELFKIVEPIISRISIIREIDGSKEQSSPEEEEFFYLCPNCEFLNRLNVRFCKKCGVEFEMEEGDEEPEVIQEIKEKEIITDKEINKMLEKSRKGNVENGQIVVVDEGTEELVEIDKKEEKEYFIELSVKDKDIKKEESREEKIQKELITEEICEEVISIKDTELREEDIKYKFQESKVPTKEDYKSNKKKGKKKKKKRR